MKTTRSRRVVVGFDTESDGWLALLWALREAQVRRDELAVVHAMALPRPRVATRAAVLTEVDLPTLRAHAQRVMSEAVDFVRCHDPALTLTTHIVEGLPTDELIRQASTARLVVVGSRTHARLAQLRVGSVGGSVSARACCPVVVVHARQNPPTDRAPVVVGVDGTGLSLPAIRFAADAASRYGVPLRAVHAWHPRRLLRRGGVEERAELEREQVSESLAGLRERYPDVELHTEIRSGDAARELLGESDTARLLVVGARGVNPATGILVGSVSQPVLREARCPVAVVRAV